MMVVYTENYARMRYMVLVSFSITLWLFYHHGLAQCFRKRYHALHFIDEGSKLQRSSMLTSRFEISCVLGPGPYNRAWAPACFHTNDLICIDKDLPEFC